MRLKLHFQERKFEQNGFNKSTSIIIAKRIFGKTPAIYILTGASTHKFLFDKADTEDSTKKFKKVWVNSYNSALQIIPNQNIGGLSQSENWFLG